MRQSVMIASALLSLTAAAPLVAQPAQPAAAAPARPAPPPRGRAPALDVAVEAAQTAIQTCLANGYKTTALVTDADGVPVALLSADGAPPFTQDFARRKVAIVTKYKVASGTIADRVDKEPALRFEIMIDPKISFALRGALPLMAGTEQIGAIAVSGAPGGDKDEVCAQAALTRVADRLR